MITSIANIFLPKWPSAERPCVQMEWNTLVISHPSTIHSFTKVLGFKPKGNGNGGIVPPWLLKPVQPPTNLIPLPGPKIGTLTK